MTMPCNLEYLIVDFYWSWQLQCSTSSCWWHDIFGSSGWELVTQTMKMVLTILPYSAGLFRGRKFSWISRICPSSRRYCSRIFHARAAPVCACLFRSRGCGWYNGNPRKFYSLNNKSQPFAKIFSHKINPLYGSHSYRNWVHANPFTKMREGWTCGRDSWAMIGKLNEAEGEP